MCSCAATPTHLSRYRGEMLCPVCKQMPLTGRQKTCGSKCRSARYRERKQQQRDTSHQSAEPTTRSKDSATSFVRGKRCDPTTTKLEQLVSAATARVVAAIQQLGALAPQPARDAWRVDIRDQVTSQAPKLAVGYRLVLAGQRESDAPMLSPKRSRVREVAWYTLTPFEYPDDLRLRDDRWYRIVWIDAQGHRLRLGPGESVPGLYYFVGPAQPGFGITTVQQSAQQPAVAPIPQGPTSLTAHANDSTHETEELVNTFVAELEKEQAKKKAASAVAVQVAMMKPSLLATLPPQLVAETTKEDRAALATMSALSIDDSFLVLRFVRQPEWMLQLLHEERCAAARATGGPVPAEPRTTLTHEVRKFIHELLTNKMPATFLLLCKLLFSYVRTYGREVLDFLPTPLPPPSEEDLQRLQNAMSDPQKRMYLDYLHTNQESLFLGRRMLKEPVVSFTSKERTQLRRMMRDTRMVILYEVKGYPPFMRLKG